ncbi:lasso peptide biosynthesis protein [Dictyobacter arantiisoli]|uniref:Microcin J25-processing protein McjB C-terminal domain-containing protein n=1 Tax=Dictyobacter arantiisoli TaxID=2014874 RepID=A0A5A5THW4_9CHLR|nr:lasso peptide biosynthesis protein [Dictyobacter arantiisoli]GCF11181.1 hypothetical protein KDI_47450 [Dictyobacter arantiisoli]
MGKHYQLAPLVCFDDYDTNGFLLDIRQNILVELSSRETQILNAILHSSSFPEGLQHLEAYKISEREILAVQEQLKHQKLLEPQESRSGASGASSTSSHPLAQTQKPEETQPTHIYSVTKRQRLGGAGHIIAVLAELCKGDEGVYKAHQYIWNIKKRYPTRNISIVDTILLVDEEYWFYRLITGLFERRIAQSMGQTPGNEGLCLIRAFALCAYLLSLGVPARMVIGRPKYGSGDGFKLHVWVALKETPLYERPNIEHGYRILYDFPCSS